jgi:hypothetical protein
MDATTKKPESWQQSVFLRSDTEHVNNQLMKWLAEFWIQIYSLQIVNAQ